MRQYAQSPSASEDLSAPASASDDPFAKYRLHLLRAKRTICMSQYENWIFDLVLERTVGVHHTRRSAVIRARDAAETLRIPLEGQRGARATIHQLVRRRVLLRDAETGALALNDAVDEWGDKRPCFAPGTVVPVSGTDVPVREAFAPGTVVPTSRYDGTGDPGTDVPVAPVRSCRVSGTGVPVQTSQVVNGTSFPRSPRPLKSSYKTEQDIIQTMSAPSASPEVEPRESSPRPSNETARSEPAETKQGALIPDAEPTPTPKPRKPDWRDVRDIWQREFVDSSLGLVPFPKTPSESLKRKINARVREGLLDDMCDLAWAIKDSEFHRGENDRGWRADPEWLARPGKAQALAERYRTAQRHAGRR